MPTIKSTAWVVFSTEAQAEATFQAVWGKEWPPGNRSRLNPQYVPVDEAFSKVRCGRNYPSEVLHERYDFCQQQVYRVSEVRAGLVKSACQVSHHSHQVGVRA